MDTHEEGKTPDLSAQEQHEVDRNQPPRAAVLHEIIRTQGNQELERSIAALWWSALAAGLTMGLSLMAMGLLNSRLPDHEGFKVIASFGYCAGFLAVILARQQLFTENTLTAVLPIMSKPTLGNFGRLLRLWGVVLVGNLCGTLLVAYVMLHLPIFDPRTDQAFLEIGRKVMENDTGQMFAKGIVSGWMIATMVWMIPSMESAKMWIITLITYLMALGDFTHIVVGSAEVSYLVFAGQLSWEDFWMVFAGPTLAGNIIGGSFIFALISHAQIRSEVGLPKDKGAAEPARRIDPD
ncbi:MULTISPECIES: formate/nitrite transporter family protein [unclassified Pseudomonas]|uniref:formate/nitrite transporter family protein n=1 Tax=unclassified Pseudomonas TaxID=196821 RepID=UPI000876F6BD|nr:MULTISPECIES: formate/nitrite transporter family protein [unclassified Pseudomonas]SCZ46982.1 Formate/nitrite transporter FocA, FNT family [Pseudomonas sp. NFACC44-2]SDA58004.1 Formate/nitrite transporter FocA, FNT family [Pseudomonas sp. NFACC51]SEK03283.1 Formate/nitrite transporter FocA, FNT family [Pseudomonas sp. NFACC07-1]SFJ35762.1 Formate/nitrite transporter FocA, FNT family [Pseudomonas sp. NFACC54]SFS67408.1 Formate/nitrite transporter FocA, FNT family [Pseudomonas sp. NFACC48-1]